MKIMKRYFYILCVLSAALVSCNDNQLPQQSDTMRVTASVGQTRAGIAAGTFTGSSFGFNVAGRYINMRMTSVAAEWRSSINMYWQGTTPQTMSAYYPFGGTDQVDRGAVQWSVEQIQTADNITASDLLFWNNSGAAVDPLSSLVEGKVPVVFNHSLAKLVVTLNFHTYNHVPAAPAEGDWMSLDGLQRTCTFNTVTGAIAPTGAVTQIRPLELPNHVYEAILVPQSAKLDIYVSFNLGTDLIKFRYRMDNGADGGFNFESGKQYNLSLNVTKEMLSFDSVKILDWIDGDDFGNMRPDEVIE